MCPLAARRWHPTLSLHRFTGFCNSNRFTLLLGCYTVVWGQFLSAGFVWKQWGAQLELAWTCIVNDSEQVVNRLNGLWQECLWFGRVTLPVAWIQPKSESIWCGVYHHQYDPRLNPLRKSSNTWSFHQHKWGRFTKNGMTDSQTEIWNEHSAPQKASRSLFKPHGIASHSTVWFPFISSSLNLKDFTVIIKHTKDVVQTQLSAPSGLFAKDDCYP